MKAESSTITPPLSFRKALAEEADFIAGLINSAYRGDSSRVGWTTEADLLGGQRTDEDEVHGLIEAEGSMFLLCLQGEEIIGSVNLQKKGNSAYLGMFVVRPDLQGIGIGKHYIQAAESISQTEWGIRKMTLSVITFREELVAFYERRGYRRTGQILPFPTDPAAGIHLVEGLQFEMMEKDLGVPPHFERPGV